MIHAHSLSSQARLAENDDALPGHDHFLHIMQIEPPAHERLTESICLRFLQGSLKNLFPSAETAQRGLDHLAAKTNRNLAFLARKMRELSAIFVAPGEMREQILHFFNPEAAQCE
jgi:hypothetical protein